MRSQRSAGSTLPAANGSADSLLSSPTSGTETMVYGITGKRLRALIASEFSED